MTRTELAQSVSTPAFARFGLAGVNQNLRQVVRAVLSLSLLACGFASAAVIQFSGGPTTTVADTEIYFSPKTGEVTTGITGDSQFGISNAFGQLALAFNLLPDNSMVVGPNPLDPSILSVARLKTGTLIGPSSVFDNTEYILAESTGFLGNWNDLGTDYFGFLLKDSDGIHYGWANITVLADYNVTLNGFAYETTPNVGILAGASSSVPEASSFILCGLGILAVLCTLRNKARSLAAVAVSAVAISQVSTAQALPGETDPIGKRLMQFRSDYFLSVLPENTAQRGTTREMSVSFGENPFSATSTYSQWNGDDFPAGRQHQMVSGRIVASDHDQAVKIYADGSQIGVNMFGASSANTWFGSVLPRFNRAMPAGNASATVDFIAAAAGDLDRAIDASGNYHDEVVIAYVGSDNNVKLAVLDYSNNIVDIHTGNLTPVPPTVIQIGVAGLNFDPTLMAGVEGPATSNPQTKILPGDNIVAVTVGDFDGDNADEIAVAFVTDAQTLAVQTFRYRAGTNPTISQLGSQTVNPVPQTGVGPALEQGAMAANVTMTAGDFYGAGKDQVAIGFMQWRRDENPFSEFYYGRWAVAPRFVVNVLSASSQNTQLAVNATPGYPTLLSIDAQYLPAVPHQVTISGAPNAWNILNGTWDTFVTADGKIQINLDSSAVVSNLNGPLTLSLSKPVTLPGGSQPLVIDPQNYLYTPPPTAPNVHFSTFDYNIQWTMPKLQLVSGLFKFDPANQFTFSRRELAAVYSMPQFCFEANGPNTPLTCNFSDYPAPYAIATSFYTIDSTSAGAAKFSQDAIIPVYAPTATDYSWNQFTATAGAFRGGTVIGSDGTAIKPPVWQVAVSAGYNSAKAQIYIQELNGTSVNSATAEDITLNAVDNVMRPGIVNFDPWGNSVYLGAPVRFSTSQVHTPITILEEPPKHTAWLDLGQGASIQNINRNDGFTVQFQSSSSQQVNTSSTTISSSTFTSTNTVSAGASVKLDLFGAVKDTTSVQDTAKFSYDYEQNKSAYNSGTASTTYSSLAQTDHDDYIRAQVQDLNVWRYRVYGSKGNSGGSLFYDLTFPGKPHDASGPGLSMDWYNPVHENGNILSYPALPASGLPDDVGPAYTVNGAVPPALSNGVMFGGNGSSYCFGGVDGPQTVTFASVTQATDTVGTSKTNSWDNDTKVATKFKVGDFSGNASWEGDFGKKQSWSSTTSTDNQTSGSTSVIFNVDFGDDTQGYNMLPVVYNSDSGVLKFKQYVDIPTTTSTGDCVAGGKFWTDNYGGAPDPALNLPFRFSYVSYSKSNDTTTWELNTTIQREQMRGFFIEDPNKSELESTDGNDVYTPISSNPPVGSTVRLAARVYNYSVGSANNAINTVVTFSAAPYDEERDNEIACGVPPVPQTGQVCAPSTRIPIGSTTIAQIPSWTNGQNWVEAGYNWTIPADLITKYGATSFRIYVNLTYPQTELVPPQLACLANSAGACPKNMVTNSSDPNWDPTRPGQNNEGWGLISVSAASTTTGVSATAAPIVRRSLKAVSDSLAGVDSADKLRTGLMTVYLGSNVKLRVKAVGELTSFEEQQKALVYDGTDANRKLIAGKMLRGAKTTGSYAWFQWRPQSLGLHPLTLELMEPNDDPKKGDNVAKLSVLVIRNPADVNGDGRVDTRDISMIEKETGKSPATSSCGKACDVNGDGLIGSADLQRVVPFCDHASCQIQESAQSRKKAAKR